jgi:hypothetical protein
MEARVAFERPHHADSACGSDAMASDRHAESVMGSGRALRRGTWYDPAPRGR